MFVALDIETVPNPDIDPKALENVKEPPSAHCVVAISTMEVGKGPKFKVNLQSHGTVGGDERAMVESALAVLRKDKTLVTWGGRWFDVAVLIWACYRLGIQSQKLFECVGARYTTGDVHADLVELTSFYGASRRSKLLYACQIIGLPGKTDTDGSMVAGLYDAGEFERIRKYNCMDTAQTGLVYARWRYTQGVYVKSNYNPIVENIIEAARTMEIDVTNWDRLVIK